MRLIIEGGEQLKDFDKVYKLYFREVYLYSYAMAKDTHLAEDITAETFAKALSKLHTFRGESDIRIWLCQIARNTYISYCRKQKNVESIPNYPIDSGERFEEVIEDKDLAERIDHFVQTMDEPYREVFILRTYYELPYSEIAASLGRTESWARVTYTRAKRIIQKWIKEDEHG